MGKVDDSNLYLCGVRMNGVLIEWNPWLGTFVLLFFLFLLFFHFFTRTYMSHYLSKKICIPNTYCCGDTSNLDKNGNRTRKQKKIMSTRYTNKNWNNTFMRVVLSKNIQSITIYAHVPFASSSLCVVFLRLLSVSYTLHIECLVPSSSCVVILIPP